MALATKLKNVKSNPLIKLLTVIISVLLCIIFCINAMPIFEGLNIFGKNLFQEERNVYDTISFSHNLYEDVDTLVEDALVEDINNFYNTQNEKFTNSVYNDFVKAQDFYNADPDNILYCLTSVYEADEYDKSKYDPNYLSRVYHLIYENDTIKYSHYYNANSELYNDENTDNDYSNTTQIDVLLDINTDKKKVKSILDKQFKNCYSINGVSTYRSIEEIVNTKPMESKTISYYLKAKSGNVISNVENVDELKKDTDGINTIVISNGVVSSTKLQDRAYKYGVSSIADGIEIAYIQFNIKADNNDRYSNILADCENVNSKLDNLNQKIALCVISILLLVVLLCFQCAIAGYKDNEVRTIFVDKIPNDIHLCLTAGVITAIVFAILFVLEEYVAIVVEHRDFSSTIVKAGLFSPVMYSLITLMWLSFTEICTSFARQIKAKSGFWKNNIPYFFSYYCIAKPIKKFKDKEYKPNFLRKEVVISIIAFFVVNIFGFFAIIFTRDLLPVISAVLLIAIDGVAVGFVAKYLIDLDIIITAIHSRQMPNVNYEKLPKSLKALVDSQRVTNDELNLAVARAVKDERMRAELITNVSHDLKTPLTSIINYVDLLKQCDINDKDANEYISVLDEKGNRLKRLIDDLIEASKITSGVVTLNPVNLDLSELATQAVVEYQQEFIDNKLELVFKGDKHSQDTFADGSKAYRIIGNLLSNARKYSAKGSRVYADVYEENDMSVFEIKNISATPLDITPDELMERFVRGDKSRNQEGNGLGLSIADNLCKAMNGKLEISIDGDLFKAKVFLPKTK